MPQDKQSDPQVEHVAAEVEGEGTGSIMLTLCISSAISPGYRYAVAPLPPSYEGACRDALRIFAPYLPGSTKAVIVRLARQRSDGERVWSIISAKDWGAVLQRDGEELGVFTSDIVPDTVPYTANFVGKPAKVHIHFCVFSGSRERNTITSVNSFEELQAAADKVLGLGMTILKYDARMLGTPDIKNDYLNMINESTSGRHRRPKLEILADMDTVHYLSGLFAEPLIVYVI
ncbi:hypothetical protein D9619_002271 [Psilocybe cf. subviscida]|uniref:Uncharacterized protein n=1 Tax=Psilocybe cf. subviscida TaxID=2480587 RepID=A0A8H5F245_9AGAR|nr:hypothetical protein D9619_002271 [Psilocybe cf. subviscida]